MTKNEAALELLEAAGIDVTAYDINDSVQRIIDDRVFLMETELRAKERVLEPIRRAVYEIEYGDDG